MPRRRPHAVLAGAVLALALPLATACEDNAAANDPAADRGTPHGAAVVSAHELATEAGIEVLEAGGSAADAAVAVAAALSVVEPWFSSALGGGTWALYYESASGDVTSLDGVGPTGSLATVEHYAARAGRPGMHQSIVPGAWDGWMLWLMEYGELELGNVLAPAIRLARDGYPVSEDTAGWLQGDAAEILAHPASAAIYAPGGEVLQEGDTVHQHDMADTFEALAAAYEEQDGHEAGIQAARDYFYRGPLAEAIVQASEDLGGYLALEDFEGFEAAIVEPISIDWNDEITVFQNPPNSQGITMLIALNMLRGDALGDLGPDDSDAVHLQVEALKLAFTDRHHHVGDPDRVDVPVEELLSDDHAERQRERIDMQQAMEWPLDDALATREAASGAGNTTTFHVVDSDGNAAAVTTSLGAQFFVIGETGIHINNRMRFLALEDGDPNRLEPGYRVRHTSNPYMALREGRPYILGGNTGVDTQPQGQMQQFLHVAEFGLTAQEALVRPRFVSTAFPETTYPYEVGNTLELEAGFPEGMVADLEARGHVIESVATAGSANMIVIRDPDEVEIGAEPRNPVAAGSLLEADR